jgi:hypothetical protein
MNSLANQPSRRGRATQLSLLNALFICSTVLITGDQAKAATSVSKNGITWNFASDRPAGQYANGDWWVVGPVTITQITPNPQAGRNGTMINPQIGTRQGFDQNFIAGYNDYAPELNVGLNLPLTVPANSSVVSSITADAYTSFNTIEMFSILTVVSSQPLPGSFRPPALGSGSKASQWRESQLDYSKLAKLPKSTLSAVPGLASYVDWFSYPWLEMNPNWTGVYVRPWYMAPRGYGRDIALRTGDAALLLNLDFTDAEKRSLLIGVVQAGIDNYGFIANGGAWYNDGGHNIGRLAPLVIAAGALNDNTLKSVIAGSEMKFHEFQSTFFVSQEDINRQHGVWNNSLGRLAGTNGDPVYDYTAADLGKPEWGIRHTGAPVMDNNYWRAQYRDINGSIHTGVTMAAKVMGLRNVISWEPLFRYAERHVNYEQSAAYGGEFNSNPTPAFHKQFYNAFNNSPPGSGGNPVDPPPPVGFALGDRIQVTKNTNVRVSGALTATLLGVQVANSEGTLVAGPTGPDVNNITWWQVDFDTGVDGWTGQDNYIKSTQDKPRIPTWIGAE